MPRRRDHSLAQHKVEAHNLIVVNEVLRIFTRQWSRRDVLPRSNLALAPHHLCGAFLSRFRSAPGKHPFPDSRTVGL